MIFHRHTPEEPPHEVAFTQFPTEKGLYLPDVAAILEHAIEHHGYREWRAAILTSELHGHLGIYAILGVKMGLRACELLTDCHGVELISYAGSTPPISCLNDGLQVATGATLGHGTIRIVSQMRPIAKAQFRDNKQNITLELKSEFKEQIHRDLATATAQWGNHTAPYWASVRQCALRYWRDWSRTEIFEEHILR